MTRSWNEIRKAATAFSRRWKDAYDEKSQAQSFLKELFAVFGVDAVTQATFEHRVKFPDGSQGFVDCLWPGRILVEMKSRGKDLDAAYDQALAYARALPDPTSLPRALVVSDFARVRFYDLAHDAALTEFRLADLRKFVTLFGCLVGAEAEPVREEDPVNRRAAEKMARLHDALKAVGYAGRPLETYLVRLLFCLFAEDTSIFGPNQFTIFVERHTAADGSDLASKLAELFQTLNTPPERRLTTLDESVAAFPYVNGGLFAEFLPIPAFSAEMRRALLDCGSLDWSKISPAIFGAMFQGVMDAKARHDLGAHYTSEENILKVIRPLFLDALREEFDGLVGARVPRARGGHAGRVTLPTHRRAALRDFHDRLASLTFLDPACGCGNFLLIAYRELRRLETDVLEEIHRDDPGLVLDVTSLCKVNVSQFFGIELEPFPAEIAKVALWLMDHLCNLEVADRFGQYFARIPIKASPHIACADALTMDWGEFLNGRGDRENVEKEDLAAKNAKDAKGLVGLRVPRDRDDSEGSVGRGVLDAPLGQSHTESRRHGEISTDYTDSHGLEERHFDYIFGNPPFLGKKEQSPEQKAELRQLFTNPKVVGNLDYVTGWYRKAADVIRGTNTRCAFVSTNSITQGEQVPLLWPELNVTIDFAYRTFKWRNEAKGIAGVSCVIVGFSDKGAGSSNAEANRRKIIFDGETRIEAKNINGYLMDGPDLVVEKRPKPISGGCEICYGSFVLDDNNFTISADEYAELKKQDPEIDQFLRPFLGAQELMHGQTRHCVWLVDASPRAIQSHKLIYDKVERVREWRSKSSRKNTAILAKTPTLFAEIRQPDTPYLAIPTVCSEKRDYIPIAFLPANIIASNQLYILPNATLYHFGVLTSQMHMAWVRIVAGRLEMRYRYSAAIVYNNFIWPSPDSPDLHGKISSAAQEILNVRQHYFDADKDCSLASLYDPLSMPPALVKAHSRLDALVDKAYGRTFANDAERVAHLFALYAEAVKSERASESTRRTTNPDTTTLR